MVPFPVTVTNGGVKSAQTPPNRLRSPAVLPVEYDSRYKVTGDNPPLGDNSPGDNPLPKNTTRKKTPQMLTLDVINQLFTWIIVFCILFVFFSYCCLLGVLNWWLNWWLLRTVHVLFIFTRHAFLHLQNCMMKAFVWRFALYRSETWTLQKEDIRRLEAFEIGGVWW